MNNGPVELSSVINGENVYKIHDELRDFLHAFYYVGALSVSRDAVDAEDFSYVQDFDFRINLNDNACTLFKEKLGLDLGADIKKLEGNYTVLNTCELTPQAVLYSYTLYQISDNLGLGNDSGVEAAHNILIDFTNRICNLIKQGNLICCLKDNNNAMSPEQEERIKNSMLDLFCKHCEHFRKVEKYQEAFKIFESGEEINLTYDPLNHQRAKILLRIYEDYIREDRAFDLKSIGCSEYSDLYKKAIELLEDAASRDFAFSSILLAVLYSNPPAYLYNAPDITIKIDYIKAFNLYRSLIFAPRPKFILKRYTYAVRQILGLLIEGHVTLKPDFVYEGGDPGADSVVLGDKNSLNLTQSTIAFAKFLLQRYAFGVTNISSLNYYRAVISAFYDKDMFAAKNFLELEKDEFLKSIFLYYVFNEEIDLDALYEKVKAAIVDTNNDSIEKSHPIYWYTRMKFLELAFNKERMSFFNDFEKNLPKKFLNIVDQITR